MRDRSLISFLVTPCCSQGATLLLTLWCRWSTHPVVCPWQDPPSPWKCGFWAAQAILSNCRFRNFFGVKQGATQLTMLPSISSLNMELSGNSDCPYSDLTGPTCVRIETWSDFVKAPKWSACFSLCSAVKVQSQDLVNMVSNPQIWRFHVLAKRHPPILFPNHQFLLIS